MTNTTIGNRDVLAILHRMRDPRLRLAAVVTSLQVLGQVSLGFKLSLVQIAVPILICATIELAIVYRSQGTLVWPASAILTGNSTALLLRASGTQHGDWLSTNGIQYFAFAALVGILSKYLIRLGRRHLYNPSNLGLVLCFLVFGPTRVFPQYLWWGPLNVPVLLAWAIILGGGFWVLRGMRMWPMVLGFLVPFIGLIGVLAAQDQCFYAVWRSSPVCGANYWLGIATSPELLIFVLLMMSDPRTAPTGGLPRFVYGALTAGVAAGLIALQPTEFGVKVALLASLTVVCTFVPILERLRRAVPAGDAGSRSEVAGAGGRRRLAWLGSAGALVTAGVLTVAIPLAVVALASDQAALNVDRRSTKGATFGLQ